MRNNRAIIYLNSGQTITMDSDDFTVIRNDSEFVEASWKNAEFSLSLDLNKVNAIIIKDLTKKEETQ